MVLKKGNPLSKNRTNLLCFLQKQNISTSTKITIGRMPETLSDEQAEQIVNGILCAIALCETEEAVLEKIDPMWGLRENNE